MKSFALNASVLENLMTELASLNIVIDMDDNIVNAGCYECDSGCVGGCITHCDGGCGSNCSGYNYYNA